MQMILMKNIYVGYPESLYSAKYIRNNKYLSQMVMDVDKLPLITVVKLSDNEFSLLDGYHRFSVLKYLNYNRIKCEVL
ncbi:hypothetical protein LCGC14_1173920 [marine sediment metagenome]|uniref:ParB/Sulfiredoxin domain-containing protein n=1 Tax=marine sediment metagenome TaxID=412755 RepID=A0A0F9MC12_9ZZZZ